MTTAPRTIATAHLTANEQQMLTWAMTPITPPEKRELLYYLDAQELPGTYEQRVTAVVERILGDRLDPAAPAETCSRCFGDGGWTGGHGVWEPCLNCDPRGVTRPHGATR